MINWDSISIVNFLMFIWFNTDAFIVYFKYVRIFRISDYKEYIKFNPRMSYPNWVFLQNMNYFTKLISCKPCLCFFFTLFTILFSNYNFFEFIQTYLISYILYKSLDKYVY